MIPLSFRRRVLMLCNNMTTASTMVATIDTAISAIVTKKAESWTIDGVEYTALDLSRLRQLRAFYAEIVGTEEATANSSAPFGISGLSAGSGK